MQVIAGNIVDLFEDQIYFGELIIEEKRIFGLKKIDRERPNQPYITPGLVDAHVHIESSMLVPSEFAKMAVPHGTLGTVSDPHEIANVLGVQGVQYMIDNGSTVPFEFLFGVPSCVPATQFENAGAQINLSDVKYLFEEAKLKYLAEMMNFPGVISRNANQMDMINLALEMGKCVDGHAPGLRGEDCVKYFESGISTDHECFSYDEALEKLNLGVKVLIREGSAAKNFEALIPLAKEWAHQMMFCSDDKHPDELKLGHINQLVKRAITSGVDYFDAMRMATVNPCLHYGLELGLLREGEFADFVMWTAKDSFEAQKVFYKGKPIFNEGEALFDVPKPKLINKFNADFLDDDNLKLKCEKEKVEVRVIEVVEGQLITNEISKILSTNGGHLQSDITQDVLKIVVYNRYQKATPAIAFVKGFGLKQGAIASSVAHDSHNIIAVGVQDDTIVDAINKVIQSKGGISAVSLEQEGVLALPIAGLMSDASGIEVANDYEQIDRFSKEILGSSLKAPFMTLSFLALLVIPSLKLSDKGLFNAGVFEFVDLIKE